MQNHVFWYFFACIPGSHVLSPVVRFKSLYCGGCPLANHKSAAKRARQATRRTAVNSKRKSAVRTEEKKLVKAIEAKNVKELPALLSALTGHLTRAAQRGVVAKNTASRKIGRLSARVHALLNK
jgi:small subunit ribosomal protein S20